MGILTMPLEELCTPSSNLLTKTSKGKFLKIRANKGDLILLEGFPLYWTSKPRFQSARCLDDLPPSNQEVCKFLMNLKVTFDTSFLLNKEYSPCALKAYTGTPHSLPLVKLTLLLLLTIHLFSLQRGCCPKSSIRSYKKWKRG